MAEKRSAVGPAKATDRPGDASPFAVGLLLRRAHDRAASHLAGALRPLGLELRHFAVLIELHHSGTLNQRDLGTAIAMDKAMVVRVVDDLERAGLVERKPIATDRRVRNVEITARGVEVFDAAHVNGAPIFDDLVEHLGPDEYRTLIDLLTRFTYPDEKDR
ncbi:MarR family winged helix-turn-helix transcriptional regulator [Lentzea sp. JNUCC 0626]|uniref:MarR family winged helix-turn-helix transcriptional regulator n=1 Tax=Lentzea sp. JNUCC 0626 TaxID=3367513 RepID=UPI003747D1C2